MTICYGAMVAATTLLAPSHRLAFLASQLIPLGLFWLLSQRVQLQQKRSVTLFYQFIWLLFFAQYLLYPLTL